MLTYLNNAAIAALNANDWERYEHINVLRLNLIIARDKQVAAS